MPGPGESSQPTVSHYQALEIFRESWGYLSEAYKEMTVLGEISTQKHVNTFILQFSLLVEDKDELSTTKAWLVN